MTDTISSKLHKFVSDRAWEEFHNPKDLAIALNIEASELLENFLWKEADHADVESIKHEIADILIYAILLSEKYGFDLEQIILEKISINESKYPVEKSKGNATKWNKL